MVNFAPRQKPSVVSDICVGSWNLLSAAQQKWKNVILHGVDVEAESSGRVLPNGHFFHMDGRHFALQCLRENVKYPLILANPPFGKDVKKNYSAFTALPGYEHVGIAALSRIETTMLLANAAILKDGGYLVAIVPRTLVDGNWSTKLRKYISINFQLISVVHLPPTSFGRDISTSIIVIKTAGKRPTSAKIYEANDRNGDITLSIQGKIKPAILRGGIWTLKKAYSSNDDGLKLIRGSVHNNVLAKNGVCPVIHSTDLTCIRQGTWKPSNFSPPNQEGTIPKYTSSGDILIIRVGRNCGVTARVLGDDAFLFSDCMIVIRHDDPGKMQKIWELLNSEEYFRDLIKIKQGVSTNYITAQSLKQYISLKLSEWRRLS